MRKLAYLLLPLLLLGGCKQLDDGVTTTTKGLPPAPSDRSVSLGWEPSTGVVQGYKIDISDDGVAFVELGSVGPSSTRVTITGLAAQNTYYFRIRSYNQGGNSSYTSVVRAAL